ncbi:CCT domain-containing protein [Cephalotus follicularis]|uniref:CCT domain-containing protein n=1 Tax=Cephalotus follicularis TaxID=3775 RepID=A0A1Q3BU17_CEPFO|nr:CCT domain-containing protein [Cephalotus follicularis]
MYGQSAFPRASSYIGGDYTTTPSLVIPQLGEFDSVHSSSSSGAGSSCHNSPSSMVSCCCGCNTYEPSLIQRSISSHSLQNNHGIHYHYHHFNTHHEFLDSDTNGPVRRVFSTGDLQGVYMGQHSSRSGSPLSSESIAIIEGMGKACRYSPEEKKERIERYKSKRSQRNFNKKIKYACRKTLADSRPRIRGRFARNDEIENNSQVQWSQISGEDDENDDDNWIHLIDSFPPNPSP